MAAIWKNKYPKLTNRHKKLYISYFSPLKWQLMVLSVSCEFLIVNLKFCVTSSSEKNNVMFIAYPENCEVFSSLVKASFYKTSAPIWSFLFTTVSDASFSYSLHNNTQVHLSTIMMANNAFKKVFILRFPSKWQEFRCVCMAAKPLKRRYIQT